jgi:hypothetical protein
VGDGAWTGGYRSPGQNDRAARVDPKRYVYIQIAIAGHRGA